MALRKLGAQSKSWCFSNPISMVPQHLTQSFGEEPEENLPKIILKASLLRSGPALLDSNPGEHKFFSTLLSASLFRTRSESSSQRSMSESIAVVHPVSGMSSLSRWMSSILRGGICRSSAVFSQVSQRATWGRVPRQGLGGGGVRNARALVSEWAEITVGALGCTVLLYSRRKMNSFPSTGTFLRYHEEMPQ